MHVVAGHERACCRERQNKGAVKKTQGMLEVIGAHIDANSVYIAILGACVAEVS